MSKDTAILCIDPGTTHSGVCLLRGDYPVEVAHEANQDVLVRLQSTEADLLLIEKVSGGGRAGEALLRTVWWSGAFCAVASLWGTDYAQMPRSSVKRILHVKRQKQVKSADSKVRAALRELYSGRDDILNMLAGGGGHGLQACAMGIAYRMNEGLCEL